MGKGMRMGGVGVWKSQSNCEIIFEQPLLYSLCLISFWAAKFGSKYLDQFDSKWGLIRSTSTKPAFYIWGGELAVGLL